ncbi:MAG: AEC family transporter [Clostridia bacterium]|nr:AEC family transporter [Clostridia bacterium]
MSIAAAFKTVAVMLLCAVPGFIMIKARLFKSESISALAKLLLYICQPCLLVTSLTRVEYSSKTAVDLLIVFVIFLASELVTSGLLLLLFKKKLKDARFRVFSVAACMGNVGFMGVPVIEALLPGNAEAVAFTAAASLALNVFGWTIASAVISRDKKYISPKKIIFNPATLSIAISLPLFFTGVEIPPAIADKIDLIGRFATPLCMIIMGARLACAKFGDVFLKIGNYLTVALKQIVYPALVLGVLLLLPLEYEMKCAIYIICCCPIASMVLNFSELIGVGREEAAGVLLLGTALSCVTIPLMILLV